MKMRRIIYILSFIFLSLVSCSKIDGDVVADKQVTVEYRVSYDAATRSIGSGEAINKVWYAVFLKRSESNYERVSVYKPVDFTSGNADCPVVIAKDQSYKVVFVAQHYDGDTPVYQIDDNSTTLSMPAAPKANSENYDLFYAVSDIENYQGVQPDPVILNRVVAQVNLLCSQDNWDAAESAGKAPEHSELTITDVPQSLDLLSGNVSTTTTEVTYTKSEVPSKTCLAYAYCLAGADSSADVTVNLYKSVNDTEPLVITSAGVPIGRNKKTNINGAILY